MNYKKLIEQDEGRCNKPYLDTKGNYTIGIGHFLGKTGFLPDLKEHLGIVDNYMEVGITDDQVDKLFDLDLNRCINQLKHYYDKFDKLNEVRQAVLINMCFNMGIIRLMGFHNMFRYLKENNYEKAALEILDSKAARDLPRRYNSLVKMMRTGKWNK